MSPLALGSHKERMLHGKRYVIDQELSASVSDVPSPANASTTIRQTLRCYSSSARVLDLRPTASLGRLGEHVQVQIPFACIFGYNLSIGHRVNIGPNCEIRDACPVTIGEKCAIEANVTIMATSLSSDPDSRRFGHQIGHPVLSGHSA